MCCSFPQENNKMACQRPRREAKTGKNLAGCISSVGHEDFTQPLRLLGARDILSDYNCCDSAKLWPNKNSLIMTRASAAPVLCKRPGGVSDETTCSNCAPHRKHRSTDPNLAGQTMARRSLPIAVPACLRPRRTCSPLEISLVVTGLPRPHQRNISAVGPILAVSRRNV